MLALVQSLPAYGTRILPEGIDTGIRTSNEVTLTMPSDVVCRYESSPAIVLGVRNEGPFPGRGAAPST